MRAERVFHHIDIIDEKFPGCGSDQSGYDLEQRGLACPVVPDDAEDLTVFKLKTDIVQCRKGIEFLRQVAGCYHEQFPYQSDLPGVTYTFGFGHSLHADWLMEKVTFLVAC